VVGWVLGHAGLADAPPACALPALAAMAEASGARRVDPFRCSSLLGQPGQAWRVLLSVDVLASTERAPVLGAYLYCGQTTDDEVRVHPWVNLGLTLTP